MDIPIPNINLENVIGSVGVGVMSVHRNYLFVLLPGAGREMAEKIQSLYEVVPCFADVYSRHSWVTIACVFLIDNVLIIRPNTPIQI